MLIPEDFNHFLVFYEKVPNDDDPTQEQLRIEHLSGFQEAPTYTQVGDTIQEVRGIKGHKTLYMIQLNRETVLTVFFGGREPMEGDDNVADIPA